MGGEKRSHAPLADHGDHEIDLVERVLQLRQPRLGQPLDVDAGGERHALLGVDELLVQDGAEDDAVRLDYGGDVLRRGDATAGDALDVAVADYVFAADGQGGLVVLLNTSASPGTRFLPLVPASN